MAVVRDATGAGGTTTGAACTVSHTVATGGANTVVLAFVAISVSTNSSGTTCTATYGGTAMTQHRLTLLGSSTNRSAYAIFYLFNPATGAQNCVVTPGGAATKTQVVVSTVSYTGVGAVGTTQAATALTLSTTSAVNGYNIFGHINGAALSAQSQSLRYTGGSTSVLGVGDILLVQDAAGTGSNITFSVTGTNTTPSTFGVTLTEPNPKIATLTDDFAASDTAKWLYETNVAVTGGRLVIACTSTYSGAITNNIYDLTASSVPVEIVGIPAVGNGGTTTMFYLDAPPYDHTNFLQIVVAGDVAYWQEAVSGAVTDGTAVTWDATAMRYWRYRESAGTVYWETSPDGSTWTGRRSKTPGISLTAVKVVLMSGYDGTETVGGNSTFDNVGILPSASSSVTVTDQAQGVDTVAVTQDLVRSVTDTGQGSDAARAVADLTRTATDQGQGSDTTAAVQDNVRTVTDVAQGVDSASAVAAGVSAVTVTDQAQGVDTATVISDLTRTTTDTGQGVDTATYALSLVRTVTDTAQGVDTGAAVQDAARTGTDQALGVDAALSVQDLTRSTTDQGQGVDAAAIVAALVRTATDQSQGVDAAFVVLTSAGTVTVTDSGQGVDSARAVQDSVRTVTDVGQGVDTASVSLQRTVTVTDVAQGVDSARVVSDLVRTVTDQGQGVDAVSTVSAATGITVTDQAQGVDTATVISDLTRTTTDTARGVDTALAYTIGPEAPVPVPGRVLRPNPESRVCTAPAENRTVTVTAEDRTLKPSPESRTCVVTKETRTLATV